MCGVSSGGVASGAVLVFSSLRVALENFRIPGMVIFLRYGFSGESSTFQYGGALMVVHGADI